MPSLSEEMKLVFLVKYEFEYREEIKLKYFLWKFRTVRILIRERKTVVFLLGYSSTGALFPLESLLQEMKMVMAQNKKFEYRAKSN